MRMLVSHDVFRERVNFVLARSGMTYAAFARKAGLDRSTLSQLEKALHREEQQAVFGEAGCHACGIAIVAVRREREHRDRGAARVDAGSHVR